MPDDIPRSAHGNRPPGRRSNSAPIWWSGLERTDLPDELGVAQPAAGPARSGTAGAAPEVGNARGRIRARGGSALVYLVVAAAAAFLILIGVGASSTHSVVAALLVIAVPLGLASLVVSAVVRHSDP